MAKKFKNLNDKTMRDREDQAYNALVERSVDWNTLRARARNRLSGLLLSREDINLGRADHSLMLLAALWHITPSSMRTGNFSQVRIIRQFNAQTKEVITVDKLFNPIALRRACIVAADLEQSLLVLNDHLTDLLTGPYHSDAVWRYTSLPISQAIPKFWPHIYGILTNILVSRLASQGKTEMTRAEAMNLLAHSVRQYFSTHGLGDSFAVDDLNVIDNVVINLFMTNDLRGVEATNINLFRNFNLGGVHHLVRSLLETVDNTLYVDDLEDDEDLEPNESANIMTAYVDAVSENAQDVQEIRDVFINPDDCALVPETIQFRNTSKHHAFQDVDDLASVGFSICWRQQELGVRSLLPRELLELSAALHEVAEFDQPSNRGSVGPQPVKANRACKMKVPNRERMINVLHNNGVLNRSRAANLTDSQVLDKYNMYMSRDSDI